MKSEIEFITYNLLPNVLKIFYFHMVITIGNICTSSKMYIFHGTRSAAVVLPNHGATIHKQTPFYMRRVCVCVCKGGGGEIRCKNFSPSSLECTLSE